MRDGKDDAFVRTTTRPRAWTDVDREPRPDNWDVEGMPRDETTPERGVPVPQRETGGERPDTAGEHGIMAPEAARGLEAKRSAQPEE